MDTVFYNSGDPELKEIFGPLIILNTIDCDGFNLSYSANIKSQRINDNKKVMLTNFVAVSNGATTSGDCLNVFTTNYMDSPYIVSITLSVNRPDK